LTSAIEKFVRIRAQPDALLKHLAWIEALPGVTVSIRPQPDEPSVSVLHVVVPLSGEQEDDVEAIIRHWERENPGTVLTD
jgi:ACT domain-containing protein